MYYVQNEDGTRYGPVAQDTIEQWQREGRIADSARFIDAVTEQSVERERLLPPTSPPTVNFTPPPTSYPPAQQGQAYRPEPSQPQQPPGYAPPQQQGYAGQPPQPYIGAGQGMYSQAKPGHNPVYACLWCLLCLVPGYIYNKQVVKGIAITVAATVIGAISGGILGWFVLAAVMFDCYKIGERIRAGEKVG
ncbi:MAG: hypothetical protein H7145_18230, partial [Akkermansiaceae bacterium]|nr:hypothetical protein [Armatimonadota bacterium]